MIKLLLSARATVAQSVEQLIRNQQVAGSSPASSSKKTDFCKLSTKIGLFSFYTFLLYLTNKEKSHYLKKFPTP